MKNQFIANKMDIKNQFIAIFYQLNGYFFQYIGFTNRLILY